MTRGTAPGVVNQDTPTNKHPETPNAYPILTALTVYTKNGSATTQTNTSGEFAAQLSKSASTNGDCVLRWTRSKALPQATPGMLVAWPWDVANQKILGPKIANQSVAIAAGALYGNITLPFASGTKPGIYRAIIVSAEANNNAGFENHPPISNSVLLTYSGKGGATGARSDRSNASLQLLAQVVP